MLPYSCHLRKALYEESEEEVRVDSGSQTSVKSTMKLLLTDIRTWPEKEVWVGRQRILTSVLDIKSLKCQEAEYSDGSRSSF